MPSIKKLLQAAAGNAGGGISYWINEVDIDASTFSYNLVAGASEARESVIVRAQVGSEGRYIELDNAGDYLRSGSETTSSNQLTFIPFNNNYLLQAGNSTDLREYYLETGTSSTALQYSYSGVATSNVSGGYGLNALAPGLTSDTVCYAYGKRDYYYSGPYLVWIPYMYVSANYEPLASPVTNGARQFVGNPTLGDSIFWQPAVSENTYSGKHSVCFYESFSASNLHIADINGSNVSNETRTIYSFSDTPTNIFVDSTGKTTIVAYEYTNKIKLLRGSTAGSLSSITSSYKFTTSPITGALIASVMDSNDNIYLLTDALNLFKFTTSDTIEWSLSLTDSRGSFASRPFDMVLGVEGDTEYLYIAKQAELNSSPANYKLHIWKLPLDANNYTGTYGTYTISSFTNPTITSSSISNSAASYSNSAKTMSNTAINSPTQATELSTHTTNVTTI